MGIWCSSLHGVPVRMREVGAAQIQAPHSGSGQLRAPWQRAWGKRSFPHQAGGTRSLQPHAKWAWGMGWGGLDLFSVRASVEHLLQIRIQEHPRGVQLFSDGTELRKGRIHFLKVLPGAVVGLRKQPDTTGLVPWKRHFSRAANRHPRLGACRCDAPIPRHTQAHTRVHSFTRTYSVETQRGGRSFLESKEGRCSNAALNFPFPLPPSSVSVERLWPQFNC